MNVIEKKIQSEQLLIIKTSVFGQNSSESYYRQYDQSDGYDQPELVMYEILRTAIRRQISKPFQLFKQFLLFPDEEEDSIEVGYKHMRYEIEIVGENIRNVCTLFKQRLLVEGFITIKNAYFKRLRVEEAYFSLENVSKISHCLTFFKNIQKIYLKWEGFGRLYENYRGLKLSKINLSKIDYVNSQLTSNYLEEFNLISERGRDIEAINSYIIDRNTSNEDSGELQQAENSTLQQEGSSLQQVEKRTTERKGREDRIVEQYQSIEEHLPSTDKRYKKKTSTAQHYHRSNKESDELEQKVLVTHRKELAERQEAGSTNKPIRKGQDVQQLYLIRDYRTKPTTPSNYIKIPILSENIKIVELQTGKKRTSKHRIVKQEVQLESELCQNCKFCLQKRQRRQMTTLIQQRFEYITIHKESTSTQISST